MKLLGSILLISHCVFVSLRLGIGARSLVETLAKDRGGG
jgi:hypothetical protein